MSSNNSSDILQQDNKAYNKYVKLFPRIIIFFIVVGVMSYFIITNSRVDGPQAILNLTPENYVNTTVVVLNSDEQQCINHLSELKQYLPEYIETVVVTSDSGFTKCISVQFAVSNDKVKKAYFKDPKGFTQEIEKLHERHIIDEQEYKELTTL